MQDNDVVIGIDPGNNGGIAVVSGVSVSCYKMLHEPDLLLHLLVNMTAVEPGPTVVIERPPKFAGVQNWAARRIPGASIATLHGNYNLCLGILLGLGLTPCDVAPLSWQNAVGCRNVDKLDQPAWKRKLKAHAQVLFPAVKVTLWNADALLIAAAELLRTHRKVEGHICLHGPKSK
jgi:hypothetical protein